MFNLGFLAEGLSGLSGLGSFSGSGLGDLGHLGLGELGYLAAMTAQQRREAAAEAKRKRLELAAAIAEARRTGGPRAAAAVRQKAAESKRADAQHAAAARKEQRASDALIHKKAAADKKAARKTKKVHGKTVSIDPKEEKTVDVISAGFEKFMACSKATLAMPQRTQAERQAKGRAAAACMAMVGSDMSTAVAQIGKQPIQQLKRSAKKLRGFGVYDPVTGQDDGQPDPNAYVDQGPATNIDYQTGAPAFQSGGMDPMMLMMMQNMNKPAELPKQCQKNMNKPICAIYTLSQQSQQQMNFLITIVMQMMQQLTQMIQSLMANGPMTGGSTYPPMDQSGGMYPPPTGGMIPSFDQGGAGMPPPSYDPSADMYSQAPSGGAYSSGGVEQIPAGFDQGGDVPGGGGGDSYIPQDIPISGGGYFTPAQAPAQTYAPGGDTYIQQEYNGPIEMPSVPDAGYIPEESVSDTAIIDDGQQMPNFQRAQLVLPQPGPQELVEVAAGGAMPGPTQADIQNQYFDTDGGGDGF